MGGYYQRGYRGEVLTSSDGINWFVRSSGINCWLTDVTYGNGIFVAVGEYSDLGYAGMSYPLLMVQIGM